MSGYLKALIRVGASAACLWVASSALAADSQCAEVEIAIAQDLTLERQAFEAHMRINNGMPNIDLTDVSIAVHFADADGAAVLASSDPDSTNAVFYIAVSSSNNISGGIDGSGTVAAGTAADIYWLIIPAPGAGGELPQGTLYYVGATLAYSVGESAEEVSVVPDHIYVKPMPELRLDYFLPGTVYGDDAFTPDEIEPSIPFSLGVRVKNIGYGTAHELAIETGQPKITDNAQGLLVAFSILDSEVNGNAQGNSLLVDFGDIASGSAGSARWRMTASLSGNFTNFSATISHSDELGGELTSLIKQTNVMTHMLLRDVLVDLSGRDTVRDYLTLDMQVFESDSLEQSVTNVSSDASLNGTSNAYTLSISGSPTGFVYVCLTNPVSETEVLKQVVRSDGKEIKPENAWVSKERNASQGWDYYFNLFDVNAAGKSYTVEFESAAAQNRAPVFELVHDVNAAPNSYVGFMVRATDPDGLIPVLSADSLPVGATFVDYGNGSGSFGWTPGSGQLGTYWARFEADDGVLSSETTVSITISTNPATSGEGPAWWMQRGVIDYAVAPGTNDFAAANQGQVKHIAQMCREEFTTLPGGAGFEQSFTNAQNYYAVNVGQVKAAAAPFYDRLSLSYPWADAVETNDAALVNVGQVKNTFAIDPWQDSDSDGMPDWWESLYSLDPESAADAVGDGDGDGRDNRAEFWANKDPGVSD